MFHTKAKAARTRGKAQSKLVIKLNYTF